MNAAAMPGADIMPVPRPDTARLQPFWAAAAAGRLDMPRCATCGRFVWYPAPACGACGGKAHVWTELRARPRVFSWTVVRRALDPRMAALVPFATVMLTFDDAPGVRYLTRLVDADFDRLEIGATGSIVFRDLGYPVVETGITAPFLTLRAVTWEDA